MLYCYALLFRKFAKASCKHYVVHSLLEKEDYYSLFFPLYKREENFSDYSFIKERKIVVSMVSILSGVRVTGFQVLSGFWRRAFDHGKPFFFLLIKMLL